MNYCYVFKVSISLQFFSILGKISHFWETIGKVLDKRGFRLYHTDFKSLVAIIS